MRGLDERGLLYVGAVASDCGVRLPAELRQAATAQTQPPSRTRGQPKKPRPAARHDAQAVTATPPEETGQMVQWREGSPGPLCKQVLALRVHAGTGGARHRETQGRSWTGPEGWLLGERPLPGEAGAPKWFFSSLPAQTPLQRLVELAHLRWPVEQFYEEQFYEDAKGECGLEQFQGRSWEGVHRHVALVMLAYTFLMLQSLGQAIPAAPAPGAAFPPGPTDQSTRLPSAGARVALPRAGLRVDGNGTSQSVSSSQKLTK